MKVRNLMYILYLILGMLKEHAASNIFISGWLQKPSEVVVSSTRDIRWV